MSRRDHDDDDPQPRRRRFRRRRYDDGDAPRERRRQRSKLDAVIWAVALLWIGACLTWVAYRVAGRVTDGDATVQTMVAMAGAAATLLWVTVFWWGFSRIGFGAKVLGATLFATALVGLWFAVEVEYDGAMLPTGVRSRLADSPERRALRFAAENRAAADTDGALLLRRGDWPQFRGPGRDGLVPDAAIRTDWAENPPRVVWRHPVGPGWGSFAVVDGRLFTLEQRGTAEAVVCYRAEDGRELWSHETAARFRRIDANGGDGPASTPTFADGLLYAYGSTGVLTCLDAATGEALWTRDTLADAAGPVGDDLGGDAPFGGDPGAADPAAPRPALSDARAASTDNIQWGLACSPLVIGGTVIVTPGGGRGRGTIAYDRDTGEVVWAAGDEPASYSSPTPATLGGIKQVLVFDALGLRGRSLEDGRQLWAFPWTNGPRVNAALPLVRGDEVLLSSGYGTGSALLRIVGAPTGQVAEVEWVNPNRFKLKFNDAVRVGDAVFGLDEGILSCIDWSTGDRLWKKGRYGYGQLLLLGDVLLVSTEDGELALVAPDPEEFRELARVQVLDGVTWNHPAYANGRIYLRNGKEAVCLDVSPVESGGRVAGREAPLD